MIELQNDCTMEETLVTYAMFDDNPHVLLLKMDVEDDLEEVVTVIINHYGNEVAVHFRSGYDAGEVYIYDETLGADGYTPYGMITPVKLLNLLQRLPHIDNYLEEGCDNYGRVN